MWSQLPAAYLPTLGPLRQCVAAKLSRCRFTDPAFAQLRIPKMIVLAKLAFVAVGAMSLDSML